MANEALSIKEPNITHVKLLQLDLGPKLLIAVCKLAVDTGHDQPHPTSPSNSSSSSSSSYHHYNHHYHHHHRQQQQHQRKYQISIVDALSGACVHETTFHGHVIELKSNGDVLCVNSWGRVDAFDLRTFEHRFAVTGCYSQASKSSGEIKNALALGHRWLAFADAKFYGIHASIGGVSTAAEQSYTTTVFNTAKSISKGLVTVVNSVVAKSSATFGGGGGGGGGSSSASGGNSSSGLASESGLGGHASSPMDDSLGDSLGGGGGGSEATRNKKTRHESKDDYQPGICTIIDTRRYNNNNNNSRNNNNNSNSRQQRSTNVHDEHENKWLVAHFCAHHEAIYALEFNTSGRLLCTADILGQYFHVFQINANAHKSTRTVVKHLYSLYRGDTCAKLRHMSFAADSRWLAISTKRGTTHIFPINAYGGPVNARTHSKPYVVNRTTKHQRTAGFVDLADEASYGQMSSSSSFGVGGGAASSSAATSSAAHHHHHHHQRHQQSVSGLGSSSGASLMGAGSLPFYLLLSKLISRGD